MAEGKVGWDPLMVLRHFIVNGKPITETEEEFVFGDIAYDKEAKTNVPTFSSDSKLSASSGQDEQKIDKEYYTLQSIKYLLDNHEITHPAYVKKVVEEKKIRPSLQFVSRPDRKSLLDYLQGRATSCDRVDPHGPLQLPKPAPSKNMKEEMAVQEESENEADGTFIPPSPFLLSKNIVQRTKVEADCLFSFPTASRDPRFLRKLNVDVGAAAAGDDQQEAAGFQDVEDIKPDKDSILSAIGTEKLLELKAKRRAVKIHEVKQDMMLDNLRPASAGRSSGSRSSKKTSFKLQHERVYMDRNTILRSQKKEFFTSIYRVLENIKARSEAEKKFGPGYVAPNLYDRMLPPLKPAATSTHVAPDATPYNRYDQKAKLPAETSEFGINPLMSFSTGLLDGLKTLNENEKAIAKTNKHVRLLDRIAAMPKSPPAKKIRRDLTPIIIVPDAPPSLITILNAKDILAEFSFVSNEAKKAAGEKKMNEIIIHRIKPDGKCVPYKIVSNPERLSFAEWERVAAVFVHGKTWQFKGWPFDGNPVIICTRLNAFHLKYDDVDPDANVKQWPVRLINISRHRRHLDRAAILGFWNAVESFVSTSKPYLLH